MFSHVTLGSNDLARCGEFYDALLAPLGVVRREVTPDGGPDALCWGLPGQALPRFYVYRPFDGEPARSGNGAMVAFLAPSERAVDQAFAAALARGGSDEGQPGRRDRYGKGYYGAYLRDPEGNKVHIAYRGDVGHY
jgi:catechol 2,3-dioxygenase-like lactoylglutathione lyase family enzyme